MRLIAHFDVLYESGRTTWVSELVHLLNDEVAVLGGFGLNSTSGGIYFRYGLDLRHQPITSEAFHDALNTLAYPVSVFEACAPFIKSPGKASPGTVVSAAMLISGSADEHSVLSNESKKLVFKLLK